MGIVDSYSKPLLRANFKLNVKKSLIQNWEPKIFSKDFYWLVIKLELKFVLIQD